MKVKAILLVALAALTVTATAYAAQRVVIRGTNGNDTLTGTAGKDVIFARAGDDQVNALDGNDHVFGGPGNDSIDLGAGNDFARGGPGNDTIAGGDGNDRLFMLAHDNQPDSADCGPGYDKVWVNVEETQDTYQNCEVILKVRVTHAQSEDDDN